MSDAAATVAPAKATKKRTGGATKAKKPSDHPTYSEMIKAALSALKDRGGSSRHAILKYIVTHYKLTQEEHVINSHVKMALRAGIKSGSLRQAKGSGASGSFKLGEQAEKKAAKPKATKKQKAAKTPKAAGSPKKSPKPKKASASGAAKPKKPKAEKKAKSPAKAKSPTKAKAAKPKTTTKPKAAKSPKKPKAAKAAKPKSVAKKSKAAKST